MKAQHHIVRFMNKTGVIARDIVMMFLGAVAIIVAGYIVFGAGQAMGCNERALSQTNDAPAFVVTDEFISNFTEGAIEDAMEEKHGVSFGG